MESPIDENCCLTVQVFRILGLHDSRQPVSLNVTAERAGASSQTPLHAQYLHGESLRCVPSSQTVLPVSLYVIAYRKVVYFIRGLKGMLSGLYL